MKWLNAIKFIVLSSVSLFVVWTFFKLVIEGFQSKEKPILPEQVSYTWKTLWDKSQSGKVTMHVYDPALKAGDIGQLFEFLRDTKQSRCYVGSYRVVTGSGKDWTLQGTAPRKSKLRQYAHTQNTRIFHEISGDFDSKVTDCNEWVQL
jgi:hypothetical protein